MREVLRERVSSLLQSLSVSVVWLNFAELVNIWHRERLKISNMLVIRLMTFMHLLGTAVAACLFLPGQPAAPNPAAPVRAVCACLSESWEFLKGPEQHCDPGVGTVLPAEEGRTRLFFFAHLVAVKSH